MNLINCKQVVIIYLPCVVVVIVVLELRRYISKLAIGKYEV